MNTAAIIAGNHAFFNPESGTSSRSLKPAANASTWVDLGILSEVTVQHEREERDIFAPTPGVLRLYDVLETKRQLNINLTAQEMSEKAFEILWGTALPTAGTPMTQYNPLEGSVKRGWLKLQQYGQADTNFNTVDVWVAMKISGEVSFGENIVSVTFEARVLHSTLNTGTIA
jgi:hypothetical protein